MLIFGSMPIGNSKDISFRMIELIESSDLIIVETVFKFLKTAQDLNLKYRGKIIEWNTVFINNPKFEYVLNQNIKIIRDYLIKNDTVLFISDEGQACLNDPGYDILHLTQDIDYSVSVIPGPSVITTSASYGALFNQGQSDFIYWVTINENKNERLEYLKTIKNLKLMIIFTTVYPKILNVEVLEDILDILGDRLIVLCMSLTKIDEKIIKLKVSELIEKIKIDNQFISNPITIVIEPPM
jgi:16S rRNA C1402 (ribose-2'-O) methylase RsmI